MSRIGKKPITIPPGVNISIDGNQVTVNGPRGAMGYEVHPVISVVLDGNTLKVLRSDESKKTRALHGLTRSLINNMVTGVTRGFTRELVINGVGYKVEAKGDQLILNLGYSHPIEFPLPDGIKVKVEKQKEIRVVLEGNDKELVGLTASRIRALRPPEPYKGKGIRYSDEIIIRKAGKAVAK
ncbi:MAG TPA: 50S ribosomal protein L6 [Thermodesulfobacteriaceae bacterium]|nr:50S ribosomal protein L6 [Thermodesulfobacteriaceae bacterium]